MIIKRFEGSPSKHDKSISEIFIIDYVEYEVTAATLGYDAEAEDNCKTIADNYTLHTKIYYDAKQAAGKVEDLLSKDSITTVQISKQKLDREKPKIG